MTALRRLTLDNNIIEYRIVRSNRRKTSELFVDSKSVLIRTPAQKSAKEIDRIIKAKASWIARKQEQYRNTAAQIANPSFEEGSLLHYLGKSYPLYIINDSKFKEEKVRLTNGQFLVSLRKTTKAQRRKIHSLYNAWLQQRAQSVLEQKVQHYAKLVDATPPKIIVKDMRNRWGSATKSGILNFNRNLLKAPEGVVDYIVIHELCHLRVRDHSRNFWKRVKEIMPDYREKEEWLTSNAHDLVE